MASEVILPKLGMNADTATIVRWLKSEGDVVAVADALAEVETDKTIFNLEAEVAGTLRKILAGEGEKVAITQTVAVIGAGDEDVSGLLHQLEVTKSVGSSHVHQVYESLRQRSMPVDRPAVDGADGVAREPHLGGAAVTRRVANPAAIRARLVARGVLPPGDQRSVASAVARLAIYGAGLGAKQLLEVTRHRDDVEVVALIDDNPALLGTCIAGIPVRGGLTALAELARRGEVDGVALSFHSEVRRKIHRRIRDELTIRIVSLVDPRAIVGMDVQIGEGALIEAGTVVGPGTVVGEGVIVDVGAVVAHDCFLGPFCHLSPGCRLSGVVSLTENVMVGVGAAINSTVTVGRNVIIAPCSAVMNDVPDDVVVSGVPARIIGQSRRGGEGA